MSYIHEALRKAQKEKDLLAGKIGNLRPTHRYRSRMFKREWLVVAGVAIAVAFLSYSWLRPPSERTSQQEKKVSHYQAKPKSPDRLDSGKAFGSRSDRDNSKPQVSTDRQEKKNTALPAHTKGGKEGQLAKAVASKSGHDKASTLYSEALTLQKEGRLDDGKKLYEAALVRSPDHVSALNNLGTIYIKEKNYAKASEMFKKAVRIDPGYVDPYYNLACLYALQNDVDRSLFYLKKAISVDEAVREWASIDKDLKNLYGHTEYEKIIHKES
jgi:tetratricopeptide (TPR) repeat protein